MNSLQPPRCRRPAWMILPDGTAARASSTAATGQFGVMERQECTVRPGPVVGLGGSWPAWVPGSADGLSTRPAECPIVADHQAVPALDRPREIIVISVTRRCRAGRASRCRRQCRGRRRRGHRWSFLVCCREGFDLAVITLRQSSGCHSAIARRVNWIRKWNGNCFNPNLNDWP